MIGVSDWMIPYDIQSIHPNVLQTRNLNISEIRNETIVTNSITKNRPMVGAQFLKFCGKYDLAKLSENAAAIGTILSAGYPE